MERIQQLVHEHRRLLAAAFAALAVLSALTALRPSHDLEPLLVARHDLPSGHVVTAADLRTASVPGAARPRHALGRDEAVGRRVAGPMRAGEAMTDARVVRPGSLAGYGDGAVLTTVRVDPVDVAAIGTGDRVDVVAVDPGGESPAEIVARGVEIVTVPDADDADSAALGVVTTEEGALALAEAGLSARLSVITTS
ncbi:MAG: flagellar biosynthesis protein FlgA [Aeromicrobium sp.]|jgi:Flp pilus assembly protein CpaB|nr:flagellar biosynthesis protein FlgA [Aeromicrobium sp.]